MHCLWGGFIRWLMSRAALALAIPGRGIELLCVGSSQIIILMGLLANIIGILPTLAGFGATLLLIPITAWTTKRE